MPIAKEVLNMCDLSWKAIASNFLLFFFIQNTKNAKDKCSHCAMVLDYSFRWLLTAPSHRTIALWVHPFTLVYETIWHFRVFDTRGSFIFKALFIGYKRSSRRIVSGLQEKLPPSFFFLLQQLHGRRVLFIFSNYEPTHVYPW